MNFVQAILAASSVPVDGEFSLTSALVIMGVVLLFLAIGLLSVFGRIKALQSAVKKKSAAQAAPAAGISPKRAPVVKNGVSEEVVAVIAAAVAAMAPEGTEYAVRSVRPAVKQRSVRGQRPVWGATGLAESTRPF